MSLLGVALCMLCVSEGRAVATWSCNSTQPGSSLAVRPRVFGFLTEFRLVACASSRFHSNMTVVTFRCFDVLTDHVMFCGSKRRKNVREEKAAM